MLVFKTAMSYSHTEPIEQRIHMETVFVQAPCSILKQAETLRGTFWGKYGSRNQDLLATRWHQDFKDGTVLITGFITSLLDSSPTFRNISLSFHLAGSPCICLGCNTQVFPTRVSGKKSLQLLPFLHLGYLCWGRKPLGKAFPRHEQQDKNFTVSKFNHVYFLFLLPPSPENPTSNTCNDNLFFFSLNPAKSCCLCANVFDYLVLPSHFLQIKFYAGKQSHPKCFWAPVLEIYLRTLLLSLHVFIFKMCIDQKTARKQSETKNKQTKKPISFIN